MLLPVTELQHLIKTANPSQGSATQHALEVQFKVRFHARVKVFFSVVVCLCRTCLAHTARRTNPESCWATPRDQHWLVATGQHRQVLDLVKLERQANKKS